MSRIGEKPEPPFGLDMSFDEAMRRFAATKPAEVEAGIKASKQKRLIPLAEGIANAVVQERPPQDRPPRRPARVKREGSPASRKRKLSDD